MSENSTIDARDQRDGGWSWVQNDIYTVFLPIIGREATHLYQVMTYLIPERMRNPIFNLTIRKISEVAGMSKSTVHRELKVLHRVGLMPQVSTDPPLFVLADLKKLARLGAEELKRRLVPQGDNDEDGGSSASALQADGDGPQSGPGSADARTDGSSPSRASLAAPGGSSAGFVPHRDKDADPAQNCGKDAETPKSLSQKPGVVVPQNDVLVPEMGGSCPTGGTPYKYLSRESKQKTPSPTPPAGRGAEQKPFPHETAPSPPLENADAQKLWAAFIAELRDQLHDVPIGLHSAKRWKQICAECQDDFNACFSAWWLLEIRRDVVGVVFLTFAHDDAATNAGIAKYRKRIALLLRRCFNLAKNEGVDIAIRPSAKQEPALSDGFSCREAHLWAQAKLELKDTAAKAIKHNPRNDLEWAERAVEATAFESAAPGERKPVWTLRSPDPEQTQRAIALFKPSIEKAVGDVQFVVLPPEHLST